MNVGRTLKENKKIILIIGHPKIPDIILSFALYLKVFYNLKNITIEQIILT